MDPGGGDVLGADVDQCGRIRVTKADLEREVKVCSQG